MSLQVLITVCRYRVFLVRKCVDRVRIETHIKARFNFASNVVGLSAYNLALVRLDVLILASVTLTRDVDTGRIGHISRDVRIVA